MHEAFNGLETVLCIHCFILGKYLIVADAFDVHCKHLPTSFVNLSSAIVAHTIYYAYFQSANRRFTKNLFSYSAFAISDFRLQFSNILHVKCQFWLTV